MTNAFTIPKESYVLKDGRKHFQRVVQRFPVNMSQIKLDGSSKSPPPQMMKKPK